MGLLFESVHWVKTSSIQHKQIATAHIHKSKGGQCGRGVGEEEQMIKLIQHLYASYFEHTGTI